MINYKGTPLFGEDSSVSHTSEFFAIAGTILFWLLFLIFTFVIKPLPKKPEYKEVQIVLSSTPVVQKSEEAPAPAEAASASASAESQPMLETPAQEAPAVQTPAVETPAPKPESAPVKETPKPVEKKVETPKPAAKKVETTKAQPQKTQTPAPAAKTEVAEPIQYAVDPMEAFAAQTAKKQKQEFDWSQLDDEPANTSTASQAQTVQNNTPAFTGSAGTAATSDSSKVTSTSSNTGSKSNTASSSTSSALEGIKNSTFKGNAANGVQSETSAKTKTSGSGKVEMEMSNGRSRALLSPASPIINLSAQAAATIDASITVSISFKVNEKGNVSGIIISPSSAFKDIVKQEITAQLLDWLFEPADYSATASFEYKIVKR